MEVVQKALWVSCVMSLVTRHAGIDVRMHAGISEKGMLFYDKKYSHDLN